jgi:hypothetical protein
MNHERRQLALGLLFLTVGLLLIGLAVSPFLIGLMATPRVHVDVTALTLVFLGIGLFVAIFGALLIPFSGTAPAIKELVVVAGPVLDRIPGVSRVGDPKPPVAP